MSPLGRYMLSIMIALLLNLVLTISQNYGVQPDAGNVALNSMETNDFNAAIQRDVQSPPAFRPEPVLNPVNLNPEISSAFQSHTDLQPVPLFTSDSIPMPVDANLPIQSVFRREPDFVQPDLQSEPNSQADTIPIDPNPLIQSDFESNPEFQAAIPDDSDSGSVAAEVLNSDSTETSNDIPSDYKLSDDTVTATDSQTSDIENLSLQQQISQLEEPDFILIGVVKSGSTSLYHYMVQHPQITGVESEYLLPESVRDSISKIMRDRHSGLIPKVSPSSSSNGQMNGGPSVKESIYEINNFDLARMIKPIIDQKEVRFFDSFWYNHLQTITNHSLLLGWKWYLEVFHQNKEIANPPILRGEASPTYFASSQFTAERIKLWLPNVKLILLLRNPVRRFVSHLKMIKENHAANMRFRAMRKKEMESQRMAAHQGL